ncbi:DUF2563 family protein [Mycolicibacterium sp.]|uniref:DUF2563 family protein n=1 Tax=Mycolicibacterium sp. TaxID=2320850 RepID=UPI0037CC6AC4
MQEGEIEFDTDLLRSGSDTSGFAAAAAHKAASRLREAAAKEGIFGDFDAANSFHSSLTAVQDSHVERATGHGSRMSAISGNSQLGACAFDKTKDASVEAIESAGERIDNVGS